MASLEFWEASPRLTIGRIGRKVRPSRQVTRGVLRDDRVTAVDDQGLLRAGLEPAEVLNERQEGGRVDVHRPIKVMEHQLRGGLENTRGGV